MNELKIFENPEFGGIRTVEVCGDPFISCSDLVNALETKSSTEDHTIHGGLPKTRADAFRLLSEVYSMPKKSAIPVIEAVRAKFCTATCFDSIIWDLSCAVYECVVAESRICEFDIHLLFKENYSKIGPGTVVERKPDPRFQPDAWVMFSGEYIPVEIKLGNFNQAAARQLHRYINFYGAPKGIAVGKELLATLPPYIEFISIDDLMKAKEANT